MTDMNKLSDQHDTFSSVKYIYIYDKTYANTDNYLKILIVSNLCNKNACQLMALWVYEATALVRFCAETLRKCNFVFYTMFSHCCLL